MAIQWGYSIRGWRVGIELTVTHTYASNTQTVQADFYFQGDSGYNINDSNNSFSASFAGGSLSGSREVYLTSSGGTIHLGSITRTCDSAYGSTTAFPASMTISGLEAVGGTLSARVTHTVARRPYSQPPAPTNLVATRPGTSASVSWTNNHSTSASAATYASGIRVQGYYQGADGSSVHAFTVNLANTATSYTRTNLNTTQAVTMAVTALNSDSAGTAWSGWTYPIPAAPTGISNTRNSDSQNTVRWTPKAPNLPDTNIIVQRSVNGGAFAHLITLTATASSYADTTTAAGNSYRYRVRTKYGDKYSSYAYSGTTYNTPAAPTGCTNTRNSDTRNTVSWTNTAPNYPSTNVIIERSTSGGAFVQIATVGGTATSYIDNGTAANNYYRYRVRTRYGDKYSGYSTSGHTNNTPAAPSNVRAAKNADNSVTVSWTDNARTETGFALQRSQDGGATWVTVAPDIAANTTSYRDTAAPGGSLMYRVEAYRPPLYSEWSAPSPSITTIAQPLAPTISQRPGAYIEHGQNVQMGWVHNPIDGSDQTAFEVLVDEGLPSQRAISGVSSKSISAAAGEPGAHTLKVRTKGAHADWSPYSQTVTYTVAMPPTVIITAPATDGEVITALPYTTSWTYDGAGYDPISVDYYIQRQEEDGSWTTVYLDQTVAGSGSVTLEADTVIPRNGQTYRVHVWARAASGLTTTADRVFATDYVEPAQPVATVEYDLDRLSASVSVEDGAPIGDEVMPVSYTVLRITDEDEVVLADNAMSGTTVTDPIPPLNVAYTYRIISHAASGAISEQDVAAYVNTPSTFAINYGDGMTEIQVLRWNVSYDTDGSKEQQHQAYEGRKFPVLYSGRRRNEKHSISATILSEEVLAWSALDDWGGVCVLRTNCGKRVPVSENHSIGRAYNNVPSISVKMERVDYELG